MASALDTTARGGAGGDLAAADATPDLYEAMLERRRASTVEVLGPKLLAGALRGHRACLSGAFPAFGDDDTEEDEPVGNLAQLHAGRKSVELAIEALGGAVHDGVRKGRGGTGATTLLVVGDEPGRSKYEQALARGVRVLDLDALGSLARGVPLDQLGDTTPERFSQGFSAQATPTRGKRAAAEDGEAPSPPTAKVSRGAA
jgi:hypothetical protein